MKIVYSIVSPWTCIIIGNHTISSAIRNKYALLIFLKGSKVARECRESALCSLKNLHLLIFPDFPRKIM